MINIVFFPIKSSCYPKVLVETYGQGLSFVEFIVDELVADTGEYFCVALRCREVKGFPDLHFQAFDGRFFLQVYAADGKGVNGNEGWHNLTEKKLDKGIDELMKLENDVVDEKEFFRAGFSEGIYFSRELLCSYKKTMESINILKNKEENEWFSSLNWINLGLI